MESRIFGNYGIDSGQDGSEHVAENYFRDWRGSDEVPERYNDEWPGTWNLQWMLFGLFE